MQAVRRFLAIALLVAFGLPFASPLFALSGDSDANMPVCCRRNGKHHCMLSAAERALLASEGPEFRMPVMHCPYGPAAVVAVRDHGAAPTTAQAVYAGLMAHPAVFAQTESKLRMAQARSRQKRGPPTSFSL
jgi:hypothetical protein